MNQNKNSNHLKEKLTQRAKQNPQEKISFKDLFNPMFMQNHTQFASIDFFLKELKVKDFNELNHLKEADLDQFVKTNTKFDSWEIMQQTAINNYMNNLFL